MTQQTFPGEGFELSEDLRMLQRTVAEFRDNEIMPLEIQLGSQEGGLPDGEYQRLSQQIKNLGLWCPDVPEALGGAGLSSFYTAVLREEMSQHRAGFYMPAYDVFGRTPPAPLFDGTAEQVENYTKPAVAGDRRAFYASTEPSGGSDPARAIKTTATKDGDDWVLNGTKTYVMGGMQSDFGLVFARTDPDDAQSTTCFIVETSSAGFSREYIPYLIASGVWPAKLTLENVRVPNANVLGEANGGLKLLQEGILGPSRVPFSASNVGVMVAAQRLAVDYSKQRETFGAPLATRQAIQWMMVDNELDINISRWLTWQAAWAVDSGRISAKETAMACLFSSEAACKTVDRSQQIHGGMGMSKWMPFERWYRESRARKLELGPMEIMRMTIIDNVLNPQ